MREQRGTGNLYVCLSKNVTGLTHFPNVLREMLTWDQNHLVRPPAWVSHGGIWVFQPIRRSELLWVTELMDFQSAKPF